MKDRGGAFAIKLSDISFFPPTKKRISHLIIGRKISFFIVKPITSFLGLVQFTILPNQILLTGWVNVIVYLYVA